MKDSTKTRKACLGLVTLAGVSALALPANTFAAVRTWDAGASDEKWTSNANWDNAAGVVTGDDVVFNATGTSVTTLMDETSPFVINSLRLNATAAHTIDLQTNQLKIDASVASPGLFLGVNGGATASLAVTNGTFNVSNSNLDVGVRSATNGAAQGSLSGTSTLAFTSSNLTRLTVGYKTVTTGPAVGTIDFTNVASGVLNVAGGTDTVLIGATLGGSSSGTDSTGTVTLGSNWTSTTLGSSSSRADLRIGVRSVNSGATGTFTQSGGTFTADLTNWHVGSTGTQDTSNAVGTMNLTGVSGMDIDANVLRVGISQANATGTVTLPTGNVIINTSATIGGGTKGTLNLNRTDFAVGSSAILTLGTTGEINSTIGSVSAGIDIANTAAGALVISNTAQVSNTRGVEITFEADPVGVDWQASATGADAIFYGFKWAGDKVATLNGIRNGADNILGNTDDTLVWNQTGLSGQFAGKATLFYDGTGPGTLNTNATYIGFYTSIIPEPTMFGIVGGFTGLMMLRRRRR